LKYETPTDLFLLHFQNIPLHMKIIIYVSQKGKSIKNNAKERMLKMMNLRRFTVTFEETDICKFS